MFCNHSHFSTSSSKMSQKRPLLKIHFRRGPKLSKSCSAIFPLYKKHQQPKLLISRLVVDAFHLDFLHNKLTYAMLTPVILSSSFSFSLSSGLGTIDTITPSSSKIQSLNSLYEV